MFRKDIVASSPGKFILLGEHAVVYGKPAVALAINKRFLCRVQLGKIDALNGMPIDPKIHPHISYILRTNGVTNVTIYTQSEIPSSSGLGSSAALCTSLSAAIRAIKGENIDVKDLANDAFNAEYEVQRGASPLDTSCSTFGKGIALNCPKSMGKYIWTAEKGRNKWDIFEIQIPKMTFVVGYTGIKAHTGQLVEKVRNYKKHSKFATDIVNEIGDVTFEGMDCISKYDVTGLGRAMTQNHKLLSILGVSCRELDKLVSASLKYSYGAKLTGSGGGGSMIALTDKPDKVCETIRLHGGTPFIIKTDVPGVTLE